MRLGVSPEINALSTTELTGVGVPAKFAIEIEAMREEAAREAEQAAIAERLGANPAATSALGAADGWIGGALPAQANQGQARGDGADSARGRSGDEAKETPALLPPRRRDPRCPRG